MILILMGVSGAGKTTIGEALAARLGWKFFDGDDFHSEAAKRKMHSGTALTDEDRAPWLASLAAKIAELSKAKVAAIIACSALKRSYRRALTVAPEVQFVYLRVPPEEVRRRLLARTGHFMSASLIDSQIATLEEPMPTEHRVWSVDAAQSVEAVTDAIVTLVNSTSRAL
jgi:gluconokinase